MTEINYKLDTFEGPLDLLLSLISKHKIDINDIPISLLCDQYMAYIAEAQSMDMELSSDFIVMASELMLIKSRMLLPRDEEAEEEDPRAALAAALLEYKRAKTAAEDLKERFGEYGLRMVKDTDEISVDKSFVADHSIDLLAKAYNRVLTTVRISDTEAKKKFDPIIETRPVSIKSVVRRLSGRLKLGGKVGLSEYFREADDKHELIAMFMAMLELLKSGLVVLECETYSEDGVINVMDDGIISLSDGTNADDLSGAVADDS
ncbi:MAG: segregation/condensation protein A [Clostridia bacterium]|nr:segregation/condensation protein A [Clostridia bacterium]